MDIDLNKTKLSLEILNKKLHWMSKFEKQGFLSKITQQNKFYVLNHTKLTSKEEFL